MSAHAEEIINGIDTISGNDNLIAYLVFVEGPQGERFIVWIVLYEEDWSICCHRASRRHTGAGTGSVAAVCGNAAITSGSRMQCLKQFGLPDSSDPVRRLSGSPG
ncbi:hypothetical protein [Uliginosibacterium sp. TH139]|uniref:hypothetical protein n=1 Tax=Uliginosibacterium sp. TH139 TaxID=2067453 RepID=UPI0020B157AE|nr:hypothetical protein [Uliginosibacterium sp. TH139]